MLVFASGAENDLVDNGITLEETDGNIEEQDQDNSTDAQFDRSYDQLISEESKFDCAKENEATNDEEIDNIQEDEIIEDQNEKNNNYPVDDMVVEDNDNTEYSLSSVASQSLL